MLSNDLFTYPDIKKEQTLFYNPEKHIPLFEKQAEKIILH